MFVFKRTAYTVCSLPRGLQTLVYMLDPEELSFVQLFWLCLAGIVMLFWMCQWIDMFFVGDMFV